MSEIPTQADIAARRARLGMAPPARPVAVVAARPAPPPIPSLRPGDVDIGEAETGGPVGLDLAKLLEGRLLIQGASGAGKSWTLRRLLEQTAERVQQIVIDPEGEFREFAEVHGQLILDAHLLDSAACAAAARRAREHRVSVLLNVSEIDREAQMKAVAAVLAALVEAPREHWSPVLVAIDEAHLFAPFGGQGGETTAVRKTAIAAVTDLMSRGRKRGLCGVLATQRLARMSKSVVSEVQNLLIGLNTLDLDIRRAAETIGWDARRAFDRLPMLTPGEFVGVGPSFSRSPAVIAIGDVLTPHRGAAPTIPAAVKVDPAEAARLLDLDGLLESSQSDQAVREERSFMPGLKAVRAFIRDASFSPAGKVWEALQPLYPDGASLADIAAHLSLDAEAVAGAVSLLDGAGAVEIRGEGRARSVRIAQDMRS